MDENKAKELIESQGYVIQEISYIPEGNSHYGFDISLVGGESLIARFEKKNNIAQDGIRRDFHYNGILSLERESALCSLVKNEIGLPAPEVIALHKIGENPFLLVEKLPGKHWSEFMKDNDYSLQRYLESLRLLGSDIAQAHRFSFESYGDIMEGRNVEPINIINFSERLKMVMDLKLRRARQSQTLRENEYGEVSKFFDEKLRELYEFFSIDTNPVFVFADIHQMNYFVDENGKPTGYFDLEFCQSGDPALDLYNMNIQFFGYFDRDTFQKAKSSFYEGYHGKGGLYDPSDKINQELERLLSVGHMLSAVVSYYGVKDGLRDDWSKGFKDLMFYTIHSSSDVDYVRFFDILRNKTNNPSIPNLP